MTTIILADAIKDAAIYAQATGMRRGAWVYPASQETVSGLVPKCVVTLPSFATRRDRHAVTAMVRRQVRKAHGVEHVNVSEARFEAMREAAGLKAFIDGAEAEAVILSG